MKINTIYVAIIAGVIILSAPFLCILLRGGKPSRYERLDMVELKAVELNNNIADLSKEIAIDVENSKITQHEITRLASELNTAVSINTVAQEEPIHEVSTVIYNYVNESRIIEEVTTRILAYKPVANCIEIKTGNKITLECITI